MELDSITLADLDVFGSPEGATGLFDLLTRTQTSLGRSALRRRFAQPSSDIDEIRSVQRGVEFLTRHHNVVRFTDTSVQAVSRYLQCNITVGERPVLGSHLEHFWWTLRYRDLLSEIREGVASTLFLFDYLDRLCSTLRDCEPPDVISEFLT